VAGHLAMATLQAPILRAGLAAVFAIPAGVAGYHLAHGAGTVLVASDIGRRLASFLVAGLVAASAWTRLAQPRPSSGMGSSSAPDPERTARDQARLTPSRR